MTLPPTSLQLYAVHQQLDADLDGTLARLREIGLRHVEAFDFVERADLLADGFARHGISAPTGHAMLVSTEFTFNGVTKQVPSLAETFTAAQKLGVEFVIDPAVFDWSTREAITATAERLNEASRVAADFGLRVGYHNHAWELSSTVDGVHGLEFLAGILADEVVLEVDLYWAHIGGADVPALLRRLGDRVVAVHVKDGPTVPNPFLSGDPIDLAALGQTAAGGGEVPLEAALAAAPSARFAVIEFDHYAGDIFDGVAASYDYLEKLA